MKSSLKLFLTDNMTVLTEEMIMNGTIMERMFKRAIHNMLES